MGTSSYLEDESESFDVPISRLEIESKGMNNSKFGSSSSNAARRRRGEEETGSVTKERERRSGRSSVEEKNR